MSRRDTVGLLIYGRGNNHPISAPGLPGNREELFPDFSLMVRKSGQGTEIAEITGDFPGDMGSTPIVPLPVTGKEVKDDVSSENPRLVRKPIVKIKSRQWGK